MSDAEITFFNQAPRQSEFYNRAVTNQSFAAIEESSSGDNTILAGVADMKYVVYSVFLMAGAAVTVTWKSGSTTIVGPCPVAETGGYHVESEFAITQTITGDALVLNLSGAISVGGVITYALVPA